MGGSKRWRRWHQQPESRRLPRLRRFLDRLNEARAAQDVAFLRDPAWEATNNGAERRARQFRHLQAPCFRRRTAAAIEAALEVAAWRGGAPTDRRLPPAGRASRGRRPRWLVASELAA